MEIRLLLFMKDVAQWLELDALQSPLSAVRVQSSLGAGFSEKYNVSPLSKLEYRCFDVVSLGEALYP